MPRLSEQEQQEVIRKLNSFFRIFYFVILRVVPKDLRGATARRGRAVALSAAKGLRGAMRLLRSVHQLLEGH